MLLSSPLVLMLLKCCSHTDLEGGPCLQLAPANLFSRSWLLGHLLGPQHWALVCEVRELTTPRANNSLKDLRTSPVPKPTTPQPFTTKVHFSILKIGRIQVPQQHQICKGCLAWRSLPLAEEVELRKMCGCLPEAWHLALGELIRCKHPVVTRC